MSGYLPPPHQGLDILYRDESLLLVNKPAGLLSVPGRGEQHRDSLWWRVSLEFPSALVVHRLDMATSGVMLLALNKETQRRMNEQFRERRVQKAYRAVVAGRPASDSGAVDLPLITDWPNRPRQKVDLQSGKPSLTHYRLLDYRAGEDCSRMELVPVTGRSHQLRVHMQALGHAILGDRLYASPALQQRAERLLLHARRLSFSHPFSGEPVCIECEEDF